MDESEAEALLERVLTAEQDEERREAFLKLVGSDSWRLVLAPHVISRLCEEPDDPESPLPEVETFRQAAPLLAGDEEKIHRALEMAGSRCSGALLRALARRMGEAFVEHALDHLRTADGERAHLLEELLHDAAPLWVREPAARRAIRGRLRTADAARARMMVWLADAGNLTDFLDEVREAPPEHLDEWSALGRAGVVEEGFVNRALSLLGSGPEPLAYLFRLKPVPPAALSRTLAAAKPEWLLAAVEVALMEGLDSPELIPVVELATRLGGRHLSAAIAWINISRLGPTLLRSLAAQLEAAGRRRLSGLLWVQRRPPSANRALEHGRKDKAPDPMDAAALVRQLQGARMTELVREILERPRPTMTESVLRPLCAVNREAAAEVVALRKSVNPDVAQRVREVLEWPDVTWPEEEPELEPPASFTPLGEGI